MAEIISVEDLLKIKLDIPDYQRPYKWTARNIDDLLSDITNAISDAERYHKSFKYRVGTIIVHRREDGVYDIVDGQQRIISLCLLKHILDPSFQCDILQKDFTNKTTQRNIHDNYKYISDWFHLRGAEDKEAFSDAFKSILEVVLISVEKVSEAFQLFDSQNARGKALDPHDLLKAYHLREMKNHRYEMEHAVKKWEAHDTKAIKDLFDLYLYPIWNWSRGRKSIPFTAKEIDVYKGIDEASDYTYARRAGRAMPYFQITEPFIAGNDFFEMVDHYLTLLQDIKREMLSDDANSPFTDIRIILEDKDDSAGFGYTKTLFYCALLCYYDKFHNFDKMAVTKLFIWAFMIRVDMENLGYDSINKYAVGDAYNSRYTNAIPMFSKISCARLHREIAGLKIEVRREGDSAASGKWNRLYNNLKKMNGISEGTDE